VKFTTGFRSKLQPAAQKKLLALDGGGIRGVITLEVLDSIERIVRAKVGRPDAVLSDYFDYMAGTSTGAIIASCLALGKTVEEVRSFYVESGPDMFTRAGILRRFHYKFEQEKLTARLHRVLGEHTTLGSENRQTLLMLVMRNATTDSPWPVSNNPAAAFNQRTQENCNLQLPLWQLVRASTAAPTYFPPETVKIGSDEFLFEDGAVTMYNNPAFQLFVMATAEAYNLSWPVGEEKLLLVSVGTGLCPHADAQLRAGEMNLLYNAGSIPAALMYAAQVQQDSLCRMFADVRAGCELDREIGDVRDKGIPATNKMFTYMRYNAELTEQGLADLGIGDIRPKDVQPLDSTDHIADMQRVGRAVAERIVAMSHFEGF